MKSRVIGLLFAFVICCLMCLPFIVSNETDEQPVQPSRAVAREDAVLTVHSAEIGVVNIRKTAGEKKAPIPVGEHAELVSGPVSDANGLPILRTSYLRSNYQAFCLTGNGG